MEKPTCCASIEDLGRLARVLPDYGTGRLARQPVFACRGEWSGRRFPRQHAEAIDDSASGTAGGVLAIWLEPEI
jgi:hypothetical protein